jgi:RNA polymerase sigma factor (sigma-70 family)
MAGASILRLQSDERLAELAVDGHDAAFAAIVDRYRTPLLRYSAGIVGSARAEDAVQQALINAHDALKRTTEVRHLRSWLYRITHNTSLNVLRSVRDDVALDPAQAALADGPDAAFESRERLRETLAAVSDLPERQRAALVLRELEGRSHEEIAAVLGVTSGSARQNLMRARATVRAAVSAVTPYPLLVKLATAMASGPALAGGWTDAVAGAGAGATLAKLTAGVVATGALVGGAVGTERVVQRDHHPQGTVHHATDSAPGARLQEAVKATPAALTAPAPTSAGTSGSRSGSATSAVRGATRHGTGAGASSGRNGSSGSGSGSGSGDDHSSSGTSGHNGTSDHSGSGSGDDSSKGSATPTTPSGDDSSHRRSGSSDATRHGGDDTPSPPEPSGDPAPTATTPTATTPEPQSKDERSGRDSSRRSPSDVAAPTSTTPSGD